MDQADSAGAAIDGMVNLMNTDPYLQYKPAFAYSLPIQLFIHGVTLTLLVTLLMHLLFTTQYHYPLAPLNYCLQLSSIVTVTISVIVKSWYILHHCANLSDDWPYYLDYVAVPIPPGKWTIAQDAAWFLLQALNNGLSNITHIQFLTLLYPSRTEARLIIFILGPLAIASSGLVFTALSGNQKVLDISDSIRNVLNSTLLLIFTIALIIWGLFVNRRRAWRTDGGTAVFGFGSLFLAVITTTINFVAVAEDGIDWLQHLLFAAILWQIWLGWWWWVGSGMGIGEVEDLMERQERKKRKKARRAARLRGEKPALRHRASSLAGIVDAGQASASAVAGFTSSVTGILRNRSSTLVRRGTQRSERRAADEEEGRAAASTSGIEMEPIQPRAGTPHSASGARDSGSGTGRENGRVGFSTPPGSRNGQTLQSTNSETSSTSATPSLHPPRTLGQLLSFPVTWLQVYMRRLQHAHEDAARKMALENEERRQQVLGHRREREARQAAMETADREAALAEDGIGWGLGSFGIKEHRESSKRLQAARDRIQADRLLPNAQEPGTDDQDGSPGARPDDDALADELAELEARAGPSTRPAEPTALVEATIPVEGRRERDSDWEDLDAVESGDEETERARERRRRQKKAKRTLEEEDQDDADDKDLGGDDGGAGGGDAGGGREGGGPSGGRRKTGWSWWGPLKDWRLSDRSTF